MEAIQQTAYLLLSIVLDGSLAAWEEADAGESLDVKPLTQNTVAIGIDLCGRERGGSVGGFQILLYTPALC